MKLLLLLVIISTSALAEQKCVDAIGVVDNIPRAATKYQAMSETERQIVVDDMMRDCLVMLKLTSHPEVLAQTVYNTFRAVSNGFDMYDEGVKYQKLQQEHRF